MTAERPPCPGCHRRPRAADVTCRRCGAPLPDAVLATIGDDVAEPQAEWAPGVEPEPIEQPAASFADRIRGVVPASPVRRAAVGVLLACVLVVGAVAVARRGADQPVTGASAASQSTTSTSTSTTTTTEPEPVVTTVPPPTTTTAPPDFAGADTGGLELVYVEGSKAIVISLDGDTVRAVELPAGVVVSNNGESHGYVPDEAMFATGDDLFVAVRGNAWATSLAGKGAAVDLGPALVMIQGPRGTAALLVRQGNDLVLREVDARGRVTATSKPVPPDWRPVAARSGLVVLAQADRQQVWNPQTGETVWSRDRPTAIVAVTDTDIVWQGHCELPLCALHVTNRSTGADRTLLMAGAHVFEGGTVNVDPTGRRAAVVASHDRSGSQTSVEVHDLATGKTMSAGVPFVGRLVWSPDGRWLAAAMPHGSSSNRVAHLWRVDDDELHPVALALPSEARGSYLLLTR